MGYYHWKIQIGVDGVLSLETQIGTEWGIIIGEFSLEWNGVLLHIGKYQP